MEVLKILDQKFGELTVTYPIGPGRWLCVCSCNKTRICETKELTEGKAKDCGCKSAEHSSTR